MNTLLIQQILFILIGLGYLTIFISISYILFKLKPFQSSEEFVRDTYKQMDKIRKKNKEIWYYTCENGHKWESYSSPGGSYCEYRFGMERTRCPECKSEVCMGEVYINGLYKWRKN